MAHELKVSDETIRKALAGFGGVKRRFTRAGEWNGVTIIDDYGHHPVEIAAVLKAARESTKGQVIAVVQPHRYTRLQSLFEPFSTCFNDADDTDRDVGRETREEISEIVLIRRREQHLRRTADPKPGQFGQRLVRQQAPAQVRHRGFEIGRDVGEHLPAHPSAFNSPGSA